MQRVFFGPLREPGHEGVQPIAARRMTIMDTTITGMVLPITIPAFAI